MAEALLRKAVADRGIANVSVRSRGTAASKSYRVPPIVVSLMAERGADLKGHKSTQLTRACVDSSDLILVMDEHHKQYISRHFQDAMDKVHFIKDYAGIRSKDREIFDPIGQPDEIYIKTLKEIETCVKKIIKRMESENNELHS